MVAGSFRYDGPQGWENNVPNSFQGKLELLKVTEKS